LVGPGRISPSPVGIVEERAYFQSTYKVVGATAKIVAREAMLRATAVP
jgi:hypothetical protein